MNYSTDRLKNKSATVLIINYSFQFISQVKNGNVQLLTSEDSICWLNKIKVIEFGS